MEVNPEQELQEHIDRYLNGSLDNDQVLKFEQKLKEDSSLATEVERIKIARSIIKNYALREKLRSIHTEEITNRGRRSFLGEYSGNAMKIAAGLVLVIVSIFVFQFVTLNKADLYSNQYQSYQVEVSRGDDQSVNNPVVYNYQNSNYQDVVNIYENKPVDSNEAHFLAGNSYLNLRQPLKAIKSFDEIINEATKGGSHDYLEDAEYYLAMAYLENDNLDQAHWYFSKIYHDSDHLYHDKVDRFFYWKLKLLKQREKVFQGK